MKIFICAASIVIVGFSGSAQELYDANECGSFSNPDTEASQKMRQTVLAAFPNRPMTGGMIITLGTISALVDMRKHRAKQCQQIDAGEAFESECPFGGSILVDDYVAKALKMHSLKENSALQASIESLQEEASDAAERMRSVCNDR